jgi:uncharacterized protein YcbX
MRKIYVYPIKSLRAVPLKEAVATKYGFEHDRMHLIAVHVSFADSRRDIYAPEEEGRWDLGKHDYRPHA